MPEIGATGLAGSISALFDDLRTKMNDKAARVAHAVGELGIEVDGYDDVVKAVQTERDKVRAHVNSLLGNNPPKE